MNQAESSPEQDSEDRSRRQSRLGRLIIALRGRDWVAVAIEIAVVALGVLLAFQVDLWGQGRKQEAEERQFLERLYRENAQTLPQVRRAVAQHLTSVEQLGTVIRNRDDPERLAQLANTEGFGCSTGSLPTIGFSDTTYLQLVESGRLYTISNSELRDQIRALAAAQASAVSVRDYARILATQFLPDLGPHYRLHLREGPNLVCRIDWPSVAQNDQGINATALAYRSQQYLVEARIEVLRELEGTQRRLACILDKRECRQ